VVMTLLPDTFYAFTGSASATVTISDDDNRTVTVTVADATAGETASGQTANPGSFVFSRTGIVSLPLPVTFTLGGTATNGQDFTTIPTTVTIPAGTATVAVTLSPLDDNLDEGNETVVL